MPLIQVDARDTFPALHASPAPLLPALRHVLNGPACGSGAVTIMVHGFSYQPGLPGHCPHDSLLSLAPRRTGPRLASWPQHLGFGRGARNEGLAIGFGWQARGSIWQAHAECTRAGHQLARLAESVKRLAPDRPLHVVGHSLGARVALCALAGAEAGSFDRLILMTPADHAANAAAALASPAGRGVEVLHVASGENLVFDQLLQRLVPPPVPGDRIMGLDPDPLPNLARLRIDCAETLAALRHAGFPVAPPLRRICHRSPYLRPGLFPLYRAFLAGAPDLAALRRMLAPRARTRRAAGRGPHPQAATLPA
ncbi:hypothetical protein [Salipiger sp.]|uniref:hypothetical protein n=1 Tax=Salipiger sp. TaxID=2078585 RepID=UPI003A97C01B